MFIPSNMSHSTGSAKSQYYLLRQLINLDSGQFIVNCKDENNQDKN